MRTHLPRLLTQPALLVLATALAAPALAQFKVVGPDGRVTYTDRPPPADAGQASGRAAPTASAPAAPALPFELRQVAARFPVTLYTAADCLPCESGRQLLLQRGVPHTERLIEKPADLDALERAAGSRQVPVVRIGGQVLHGYSSEEWNSYLTAAGYPRDSRLPPGYRHPAATPLVATQAPSPAPAVQPAPEPPAAAQAPATPTVPPPIPPAGNAPPGFRF